MKKAIALILMGSMLLGAGSNALYAAPRDNNGRGNRPEKDIVIPKVENNKDTDLIAVSDALRDLLVYGKESWSKLPPGLAKRESLPPGLQKLLDSNKLPYGLLKRLEAVEQEKPSDKDALENLTKWLTASKALLEQTQEKSYEGDVVQKLKEAILLVEDFLKNYDASKKPEIRSMISLLKKAMLDVENKEILGTDAIDKLKALHTELVSYGKIYFPIPNENDVHYKAFKALLADIKLYIDGKPLTKESFDQIIEAAKAYKNQDETLKALIVEARKLLFVDPSATVMVYKYREGTSPGDLVVGSNEMLFKAIESAEKALKNLLPHEHANYLEAISKLTIAMDVFEGNVILGDAAVATLKNTETLLKALYEKGASDPLKTLIEAYALYTGEKPQILTTAKFNTLITSAQKYIDQLFDGMISALEELIKEAEDALIKEHHATESAEEDLENAITSSKAYIQNEEEWNFLGLNAKYEALKEAFDIFISSDEENTPE